MSELSLRSSPEISYVGQFSGKSSLSQRYMPLAFQLAKAPSIPQTVEYVKEAASANESLSSARPTEGKLSLENSLRYSPEYVFPRNRKCLQFGGCFIV